MANIVFKKYCNGLQIKYAVAPVKINQNVSSPYLVERFFDTYFLFENQRSDGPIFEYYTDFSVKDSEKKIKFNYEDSSLLSLSIKDSIYDNKHQWFVDRVDHPKMMGLIAIGLLNQCHHHAISSNLHWYYNPNTELFEPTLREIHNHESDKFITDSLATKAERHLFYQNYVSSESYRKNLIIQPYLKLKYNDIADFYDDLDEVLVEVISHYERAFNSDTRNELISKFDSKTIEFIEIKENNVKQVIDYINRSFSE